MKALLVICLISMTSVRSVPSGYGSGGYSGRLAAGGGGAGAVAPGQQYHNRYQDGSYDFGYQTETGGFQSERRSSGGLVTGQYGHTNPDGTHVNVEYQGQSTGGGGGLGGGASYARYSAEKAGAGYASPVAPAPFVQPAPIRQPYIAPVAPQRYTAPYTAGRPQEYAQFNLERKPDGSYTYNYQSSDSSKTESRSGDGQVQGSFTFKADDGVQRTVGYTAGQQGFLATGAHLPVTADGEPAAGTNQGAAGFQSQRYTASGIKAQSYSQPAAYFGPQAGSYARTGAGVSGAGAYKAGGGGGAGIYRSSYTEPVNEAPKPFAFNYNAGAHSRQEQQDASGVVRGSYTVNTPDGTFKQLTYQADDSGFHVLEEKQVESGGGSAASAYTAPRPSAYTAPRPSAYTAGQTYKQKSAYYR